MLEQLEKIDWHNLSHAYGEADDVPRILRQLASGDPDSRERALYSLYSNIFHQGTRFTATPYTVPFLFEMLQQPEQGSKEEIVRLLSHIAVGYHNYYLPDGIVPEQFRRYAADQVAQLSQDDLDDCSNGGYGPLTDVQCYDAVNSESDKLLEHLASTSSELRTSVLFTLAWFPELCEKSWPLITSTIEGCENELEMATGILSLGLLARTSDTTLPLRFVRDQFDRTSPNQSQLVRVACALSLAKGAAASDVVNALIEAMPTANSIEHAADVFFNDGNLSGYIASTLARLPSAGTQGLIITELCRTLEHVNSHESLDVTNALLSLVMIENGKLVNVSPESPPNEQQRSVFAAICQHGGWKLGSGLFSDYSRLLTNYGLPGQKEELSKLTGSIG